MKVLLLVDTYFPQQKSAAKHFRDLAIELRKQGHEPVVLTPADDITGNWTSSIEEGVEVVRVRSATLKHPRLLVRALRESRLSFVTWMRLRKYLKAHRFDLIVTYSPTLFWAPLVWRLKRLWNCRSYLVLRDIAPQWMLDTQLISKGAAYYFLRAMELFQYQVSDVIAVQSAGDVAHFKTLSRRTQDKVKVLYNWAPTDEGPLPEPRYREQLGLGGKTIFFYGGTFGHAQDMTSILRLADEMKDDESVFFLLVGQGIQWDAMQSWVADHRLTNIRILPGVDQLEYLALVSEIDVGLISLSRDLKTHNIPGKLLGYAYFAKPVLANVNPGIELIEILASYNAGLSSEGDFDAFLSNARILAGDAGLRRSMGANNRRLLEEKLSSEAAVHSILGSFGRD